eukprot:tig00000980_g6158.t1
MLGILRPIATGLRRPHGSCHGICGRDLTGAPGAAAAAAAEAVGAGVDHGVEANVHAIPRRPLPMRALYFKRSISTSSFLLAGASPTRIAAAVAAASAAAPAPAAAAGGAAAAEFAFDHERAPDAGKQPERRLREEAGEPAHEEPAKTSVVLRMKGGPGALGDVLGTFKANRVNITRIESRPSKGDDEAYDVQIDLEGSTQEKKVEKLVGQLRRQCEAVSVLGPLDVPWFPRSIADLDEFANRVLAFGAELDAEHPGFKDGAYRARRAEIVAGAAGYRHGAALPEVEYTAEERATWRAVYTAIAKLAPTHACRAYNHLLPLFQHNCGYGPERIPQLREVSAFLADCTGFRLRPVMGLLSPRDFLAGSPSGCSTARSTSGTAPRARGDARRRRLRRLLAGDRARLAGASDEDIARLSTLYWYTVEFGLVREAHPGGHHQVRAYGAGLLSSPGELQYAIGSGEPERRPFDLREASLRPYPITEFQPVYYVAPSFAAMTAAIRRYADETLRRPFHVRYHAHSQTIEVDRNVLRAQ